MHRDSISKSPRLKKYARKYLLITFSIVLAFAAYIQSTNKAEAFPIAIPAGITIGAGVYTIGGMLIAAGAGQLGYEEERAAIDAHSQKVWQDASQASKESLNWSIEAAKGLGNGIVNLQGDFINFIDGKLANLASEATAISAARSNTGEGIEGVDYPSLSINSWFKGISFSETFGSQYAFHYNGILYSSVQVQHNDYRSELTLVYGAPRTDLFPNADNTVTARTLDYTNPQYDMFHHMLKNATDYQSILNLLHVMGHAGEHVTVENWQENNAIHETNMNEVWKSMKDAGLVLPVDSAVAIAPNGVPATYNADANTYTGIDGGVYAPGDMTWQFPQVKWRDKTDAIPLPGIWVETPVLTGNPAYDDAITQAPTITHVTTGTTIANPDLPAPGGGTPTKPPDPTPKPLPRVPGSGSPVPIAIFLLFFDLLRALIMYLVRMFNWIMTIPFVDAKPIDNPYFQWFRHAKILGVYPYTLVATMATFFLGFSLVKSVRRFLP